MKSKYKEIARSVELEVFNPIFSRSPISTNYLLGGRGSGTTLQADKLH